MKAKYQKYYDALKGVDLSSSLTSLSSAVSKSNTELSAIKSDSAAWQELGATSFNDVTLPGLISSVSLLSENISGALTEVTTKTTELVSKLTELESLEKDKESLGSKWTYTEGGSNTQSEVDDHNNKIDELEKKITEKESEIDSLISAINSITLKEPTPETTQIDTSGAGSTVLKEADGSKISIPSDPAIAAKKKQFIGDVDDPNNYDAVNPNYRSMRKTMQLFDNTTGEILDDHATITMKPGETRVITVKLPTNTGMINEIHRTSADGSGAFRSGKIVKAKSDIDPDPNNIEYVNFREWSNHYPANKSLMHNNSYDWVITAVAPGKVQVSQTCQYTTSASKGENLKAMINMVVDVQG